MKYIIVALMLIGLGGCTTLSPQAVVSPSEISVADALRSVGTGLVGLKEELDTAKIKTGLLVDEVTLTLNLTSKATDTKTLAVDISKTLATGAAGVGGKLLGLSSVETAEGSRGSVLVIKLKNSAVIKLENPKLLEGTTIFSKPPSDLK